MRRLLLLLRSNWISATGAILTTLSCMLFLTTFVYFSLHGGGHGPYLGLFAFVVLPGMFVVGLLLIPAGLVFYRRQLQQRMELLTHKPIHLVRVVGVLTLVNLAIAGTGGYEAVHYMDSQQFCGTLCHEVMSPTYVAYQDSAHARVACVECHIGPGASWFVKSKMSGLRQVAAVLFDTYQRPIPSPVHNLRPARETCEQCHWPDKFAGDKLVVRQHFADDEAVTPSTTVLVLKTGGTRPDGKASGIHWHVHPGNKVTYVATDGKRGVIPWIKFVDATGKERIFTTEGVDPQKPPVGELRTIDCVDCHNQPSHGFQEPEAALDAAIASGMVSRRLPFVRKIGLEALHQVWTRDTAKASIRAHLDKFYAGNAALPDDVRALIPGASDAIADIWLRNIHPQMGITWGTYPNFQGHKGCMRCHDGEHTDADAEPITMDCATCHAMLAQKEQDPEIVKQLGLKND
jgi:hypothetical protein